MGATSREHLLGHPPTAGRGGALPVDLGRPMAVLTGVQWLEEGACAEAAGSDMPELSVGRSTGGHLGWLLLAVPGNRLGGTRMGSPPERLTPTA